MPMLDLTKAANDLAEMRWEEGRNPDPEVDSPRWDELPNQEGMKSLYRREAREQLEEVLPFIPTMPNQEVLLGLLRRIDERWELIDARTGELTDSELGQMTAYKECASWLQETLRPICTP